MPGLSGASHGSDEVTGSGAGEDDFKETCRPDPAIRSGLEEHRVSDVSVPVGEEFQELTEEWIERGRQRWPVRTGF